MAWSAGAVLTAAQMNTYVPQGWSAWTPTVTASSGTFTTVSGSGRYIQSGKTVVWTASISITTVGTAATYVRFTLPVNANTTSPHIGGGRVLIGSTSLALQVFLNTTSAAYAVKYDDTSAIGAGNSLHLSGTYEAA